MKDDTVYHIGVLDENGNFPITMSRDYAIELASYYANKRMEPVTISMTVHGSAKVYGEYTIYPDITERFDDEF